MKYVILLFCLFLIQFSVNAQGTSTKKEDSVKVVGYAYNMKHCAVVVVGDTMNYTIDKLLGWDKEYYGKQVVVSGVLEIIEHKEKEGEGVAIRVQQIKGGWVERRIVDAKWELLKN